MTAFDVAEWQQYCETVIRPAARATDLAERVDEAIWVGLCERGYLGLFHAPISPLIGPAMMALAEACGATFWRATLSTALAGQMISAFAAPAVRSRWLDGLTNGNCLGAFAASERGSGSDPASYAVRLRRRADRWVLSGSKDRITGISDAAVAAVLCPAEDDAGEPLGLALAFVDLADPRVTRTRRRTLGLRGMSFGELAFADVVLKPHEVTPGTSMSQILTVVEWGQVVQALCGLGVGSAALADAERFLADRHSFGRPLAENPVVRAQLEDARDAVVAGGAIARRALAIKVDGGVAGETIVVAKIFCTEAGLAACQTALRLCGGWGYTTELEVERMVRDAHGNIPAGLPNDRLRELLIAPRVGVDPWAPHDQTGPSESSATVPATDPPELTTPDFRSG
ncbi:MAG: acyl-CoA dehydrogenase family protein [Nocardioides sp.]